MDIADLRRAFRARPGTHGCERLAAFLGQLPSSELAWQCFARLLDQDVVPVVVRHHGAADADEIASHCRVGAFELWIVEWLSAHDVISAARSGLQSGAPDEAWNVLTTHRRFRGERAERADALWTSQRHEEAIGLIEGTRSARSHFIARAREKISELQRKQLRQSRLLSRHCLDALGMPPCGGSPVMATHEVRSLCGAELQCGPGERASWLISALPPAHLVGQELAERMRRMLEAIEALGPSHARVFKLLLEGLSQCSIAEVEGCHPAAISRRVRSLQDVCRVELLG